MTRVVENLVTKTTLDTSGLAAGAQQAVAIFNQLGATIGKVQGLVLPGIAGLGAAFGSRAALNQFKDYRETGDDGMAMRAKGAKEYEEALEAAHAAAGHLAAVIGQQLAPNATSAAEAFATIAGWVENITIKTIDFWKAAVATISGTVTSWVEGFDFIGNSWDGLLSAIDTGFSYISATASNSSDLMTIAWTSSQLAVVRFANQAVYFLTKVIPASVTWFADNWVEVFQTAADFIGTILTNLATNFKDFFEAVWAWINGDGFDFEFTGLLDGFESSLSKLPEIAEREIGPLEKSLQDKLDAQVTAVLPKLEASFKASNGSFKAGLAEFAKSIADFATTGKPGGNLALTPDMEAGGGFKSVGALQFGTKEAYSAILKATDGGNDFQQKQLGLLGRIADNTKSKPKKASVK